MQIHSNPVITQSPSTHSPAKAEAASVKDTAVSGVQGAAASPLDSKIQIDPADIKSPHEQALAKLEKVISGSGWAKLERTLLSVDNSGELIHSVEDVERFAKFAEGLSKADMEDFVSLTSSALHGSKAIDPRFGTTAGSVSFDFSRMMETFEGMDEETLDRALEFGAQISSNAILIDPEPGVDSQNSMDYVSRDGEELAARNFMATLTNVDDPEALLDALEPWDHAQQINLMEFMVADADAGVNLATDLQQYSDETSGRIINYLDGQLEKRLAKLEGGAQTSQTATVNGRANDENWNDRFASTVDTTIKQMSNLVHDYELSDGQLASLSDAVISQSKPQDQRAALELATQALAQQTVLMKAEAGEDKAVDLTGEAALVDKVVTMMGSEKLVAAVTDATFSGNTDEIKDLTKLATVTLDTTLERGGNDKSAEKRLDAFFGQYVTLQDGVNRVGEDAEGIAWQAAEGTATVNERTGTLRELVAGLSAKSSEISTVKDSFAAVMHKVDLVVEGRDIRNVLDVKSTTQQLTHFISDDQRNESPQLSDDPLAALKERYDKQIYDLNAEPGSKTYEIRKGALMRDIGMALEMPGSGAEGLDEWVQDRKDALALADKKDAAGDLVGRRPQIYLLVQGLGNSL